MARWIMSIHSSWTSLEGRALDPSLLEATIHTVFPVVDLDRQDNLHMVRQEAVEVVLELELGVEISRTLMYMLEDCHQAMTTLTSATCSNNSVKS